ncbi:MAG: hypothetical protein AB4040_05780 [Synechococcus sp.]
MNTQLSYRGLPFQMNTYKTVETNQEAVFRGRKSKVLSPVKHLAPLSADIQFRGRKVANNAATESIHLNTAGLMPA